MDFHVESLVCNICWQFRSLQASSLHYALSKLTFLLKTMFKEEYTGHTRLPCAGTWPFQIICVWLVSSATLASGIIAKRVHDLCQDKSQTWCVKYWTTTGCKKLSFLYLALVCEQCNGFTRHMFLHNELFIVAYCLKSSLVLSLDLHFPAMVGLYCTFK